MLYVNNMFFGEGNGEQLADGRKDILLFMTLPGIGDFINTIPAVRVLRESLPGAKILTIVKEDSRYLDLLPLVPELGEIIFINSSKAKLLQKIRDGRLIGIIRAFARTVRLRPAAAAIFRYKKMYAAWSYLARIPMVTSPDRKAYITHVDNSPDRHMHEHYLRVLRPIGVDATRDRLDQLQYLTLPESVEKKGRDFVSTQFPSGGKTVFLCIGGSIPAVKWGYFNFAELARRLSDTGYNVLIVRGPFEADAEPFFAEIIKRPNVSWTGGMPLIDLCGVLRACDVLVGGSTGPTHIANAVGTAVVGVFPDFDAAAGIGWYPRGLQACTIYKKRPDGWDSESPETLKHGYVHQIPCDVVFAACVDRLEGGNLEGLGFRDSMLGV